jgi:hypothetical protein
MITRCVILVIYSFHVTVISCFTAKPYKSKTELYSELTSRTMNVMENVLAGIAFDDSDPFPENIQVSKSIVEV